MNPRLTEEIMGIRMQREASSLVSALIKGQYQMEDLMDCFFSDDWVLCQKASWPLTKVADDRPDLVIPYIEKMIENLQRPVHDAVIRNTVRTWQSLTIPEELEGPIYELCFQYMIDPKYPIAIRVFSMTVCCNIAIRHPGLAIEIIPVIEDNWDLSSAGWRSRGKKELKRLRSIVQ